MPNARSRSSVACLTVVALVVVLVGWRDDTCDPQELITHSVIPGWCVSTRPGISSFRVRCFASPRNDVNVLPRRGALHGGLARGVRDPQLHAIVCRVGI